MTTPVVSVVMAAYNGAALIGETLQSLAAQTMREWEAIVVDDCSTDDTLALLRSWPDPRVRVIASEANGGPVRARNRAFAQARGRYVAGLDQDDLCRPHRFARQVAALDADPRLVLVGSAAANLQDGVVTGSTHVPVTTPALIRWLLQIENPLVWSSVMLRADAARRLNPFTRPELLYAEDFDLYQRLARVGDVARIDEELLVYRRHAGGASQRYRDTMERSAGQVLASAYRDTLGDDAEPAAALAVRHLMIAEPVPDGATLRALGGHVARLQAAHLARYPANPADLRLIRWTTARRWAAVCRAGLRAGTITLADAVAARLPHLGLGYAGPEELLWSRLIGSARSNLRRARQTFAA